MLIIPARALAIFHLYQQGCVRVEFQTEYRLPRLSYLHKKDNAVHFNLTHSLPRLSAIYLLSSTDSTSTQLETHFGPEKVREGWVWNSQPENSLISLLNLPGFNARGTMPLTCISGP